MARANPFWPTAVVGEADSVNSVSASACHIGGPKGVSPGQKALLHGTLSFCVTTKFKTCKRSGLRTPQDIQMLVMNRPVRVFLKSKNRFVGDPQNFLSSSNVNLKSTLHTDWQQNLHVSVKLLFLRRLVQVYIKSKVKLKLECDETHT